MLEITAEQQMTGSTPQVVEEPASPPAQEPPKDEPPAQEQEEAKAQEDTDEQPRDEKGKFKSGVQQRFDELTRKRGEAEREAAYWRQRAEAATAPTEAKAEKPTPDKFNDYGEYVEALTEWKADEKVRAAMAERDQQQAKVAQQSAQDVRAQTWAERVSAASKSIADFDEVLSTADVAVADHVREAILDSEAGPKLAYHLAKNPAEADRISRLSPTQAAMALGRIEASFAAPPPPVSKPVTKAPAPLSALNTSQASGTKAIDQMDQSEYEALRKKQGAWWA